MGPYRDYEANDLIAQAVGGPAMFSQGQPGREPLKYVGNTGQYYAGMTAALAVTGAVFAAKPTVKATSTATTEKMLLRSHVMGALPPQTLLGAVLLHSQLGSP